MTAKEAQQKITDIANKIVAEFDPEKIILFGSQAWGEPTADSDVDLLIIKKTKETRLERGKNIERILMGSGLPIDALVYTPDEIQSRLNIKDFFIEDVISQGRILYDRRAAKI